MKESKTEDNETHRLTPQQIKVLILIAEGLQNKEIAFRMGLSVSTVKQHVSGIMLRLDIRTRTGVVTKAQKLGLIDLQ